MNTNPNLNIYPTLLSLIPMVYYYGLSKCNNYVFFAPVRLHQQIHKVQCE